MFHEHISAIDIDSQVIKFFVINPLLTLKVFGNALCSSRDTARCRCYYPGLVDKEAKTVTRQQCL